MDIIRLLSESGLVSVSWQILEQLTSHDLKCCQLVSKFWFDCVKDLLEHHERNKISFGWYYDMPTVTEFWCRRERAVCTVSSLKLDEMVIVCALGSSGIINVWDRRNLVLRWEEPAHEEGVYCVDMNQVIVVSGGHDYKVKIWSRENGALLQTLDHHEYIVWEVQIWTNLLITCAYDCTIWTSKIDKTGHVTLTSKIKGPHDWGDGLALSRGGQYLCTFDDSQDDKVVHIWTIPKDEQGAIQNSSDLKPKLELKGHQDDVHCVKFLSDLIFTASADKTVRIWNQENGNCLCVLAGMSGKIWSLDVDWNRIVAGGRRGQVMVWSLQEALKSPRLECGRSFNWHSASSSVGQVVLENTQLVTADGIGHIMVVDFWKP